MRIQNARQRGRRLLASALCFALLAGFFPVGIQPAAAAEADAWVQTYLEKLVDWGVMRGDQSGDLEPDRAITRSEYVSMTNRAYGYSEYSSTPFSDVPTTAWYAEDIGIGYNAGYFSGTSESTASPDEMLTREQAAVILSRNMVMQPTAGESLDFTDSRMLGDWSRGLVKTATDYGVLKGYPDGSFKPQNNITRGEVASMLVNAIGTPINKPGDYTMGNVAGNVTITASGVTLKNTTIAGDLYLTGGVGLGNITLENVTVLGKIIASGAGESNKGESSILLRNVEADEMVVDAPANQFVSLRAEGDTLIGQTSVRTPAYIEDTTGENFGLKYIEINGEDGTALQVAGNIKEVANLTPNGSLTIARGTAKSVTMDEKGVGGKLTIDQGASAKEVKLDVATTIDGQGDIEHLTVSAAGSTSTIRPDKTTIRPGITADIAGENLNTVTADEASQDPRILSGYPRAGDVAPATANVVVSTNKAGTVYWAVSSITDGSVEEDDLVNPPTYGSKIFRSGNIKVEASNKEKSAKIAGLTSDGSYYLSSVLVDARGQRSPVKVIAFTTPDDTVPNFATNYPYMSQIGNTSAQVTVMPTKSCKLYYALMPKGATAPKAAEFKAGAVSGNLGFGVYDVVKSNTYAFTVNDKVLVELETYDLYLWLNDADGAKSSAVKKLTFTTVDKTPPRWLAKADVTAVQAASVGLTARIDEVGTLFWVVVKADSEYPKPLAGTDKEIALSDLAAKVQVSSGLNALKSGKIAMAEEKDATFNITGLAAETAYDLYYVAQDKAGNYSEAVEKKRINTLDNSAPKATLTFDKYNGNVVDTPSADTNVFITFSESVQTYPEGKPLTDLYKAVQAANPEEKKLRKNEMAKTLESVITLYDLTSGTAELAKVRNSDTENEPNLNWTIDYRNAQITTEDGKTVIKLPTNAADLPQSALNLRSGSTYRFELQGLADMSEARNIMGKLTLPDAKGFTTLFAQVDLKQSTATTISKYKELAAGASAPDITPANPIVLHLSYEVMPKATRKVDESIYWDMLLWSDTPIEFQLFRREKTNDGTYGGWTLLNQRDESCKITVTAGGETPMGASLTANILDPKSNQPEFEQLFNLDDGKTYEYGVWLTKLDGGADEMTWSQSVKFKVGIAAGFNTSLANLATRVTPTTWKKAVADREINSIGNNAAKNTDELELTKPFSDKRAPEFVNKKPSFEPGDTSAILSIMLDRPGTIFYMVAPREIVDTKDLDGNDLADAAHWDRIPKSGDTVDAANPQPAPPELQSPTQLDITGDKLSGGNPTIKWGRTSGNNAVKNITVEDLIPAKDYIAYFVLQGTSSVESRVLCYQFTTEEVVRPTIRLDINNPSVNIKTDRDATVDYLLISENSSNAYLSRKLADYKNEDLTGTGYEDFTFLQALTTSVMEGPTYKGTVFDKYANQGAKEDMAAYIRNENTGSGGVALKGSVDTKRNVTATIDCSTNLIGTGWYVFLAVGRSPVGSGDAFAVARPVYQNDATPPMVTNCSSAMREITTGGGTYEGRLTLTFSEGIYYITRDASDTSKPQTKEPVEAIPGTAATPGKGCVTLLSVITGLPTGDMTIVSNRPGVPMVTAQFDFRGIRLNETVTFDDKLGDESGNVNGSALTLKLVQNEDGTVQFVVATPSWDAT